MTRRTVGAGPVLDRGRLHRKGRRAVLLDHTQVSERQNRLSYQNEREKGFRVGRETRGAIGRGTRRRAWIRAVRLSRVLHRGFLETGRMGFAYQADDTITVAPRCPPLRLSGLAGTILRRPRRASDGDLTGARRDGLSERDP